MNLFYAPDLTSGLYHLNKDESRHCIKVLRLNMGDALHITNGRGTLVEARLIDPDPKKSIIEIMNTQEKFEKRNYRIHIAVAPTKNISRFEWFLEKTTEIGIDEITPLICEHSERKVVKPERLERILIGAIKQSLKAYLPVLNEAVSFSDFISKPFNDQKFIASYAEGNSNLKNIYQSGQDVLILIGPEGDFSPSETEQANNAGFSQINLGNSRLRTETAGVVACHTVYLGNQLAVGSRQLTQVAGSR